MRLLVILVSSSLTKGSAGSASEESTDGYEHLEALKAVLLCLPQVHVYVLDTIVPHVKV